ENSSISGANATLERMRSIDGMLRPESAAMDAVLRISSDRFTVHTSEETRRRARQARRRHPETEEQVRPVLHRNHQTSARSRTARRRGLHPRARKAED